MNELTELAKMGAVKEKSQAIGEFIEWLRDTKSVVFAEWVDEICESNCRHKHEARLVSAYVDIESWLAQFFDIDLDKVEKEKRAILKALREKTK